MSENAVLESTPSGADERPAHPAVCENCAAALQGHYCHACGQSAHNPVRNFAHAVEEVFESFWHLDGRIFRTMRDLWVPGRVARNYLAGHRVRYIPPLRLFVILSLLTFFVGKLVLHVDTSGMRAPEGFTNAEMAAARSEPEVRAIEKRLLDELAKAEREAANTPGVSPMLVMTRVQIEGAAASRIAALREQRNTAAGASRGDAGAGAPPSGAPADASRDARAAATAEQAGVRERGVAPDAGAPEVEATRSETNASARSAVSASTRGDQDPADTTQSGTDRAGTDANRRGADDDNAATTGQENFTCRFNDRPFDPVTNPVDSPMLPAFADRWFNARIAKGCRNAARLNTDADSIVQSILGAVPTALFLLMPVFALLLKIVYLGSGRSYLEHLVVALYSHAFLLLMLMALFVLGTADEESGVPAWLDVVTDLGIAAVWIWTPIYVLLMQKRVYRGGWPSTLLRYVVIGNVYVVLVGFAAAYAALVGVSS